MEAHLRPGTDTDPEEGVLISPAGTFEQLFEMTYRRLYTALCLVVGDRYEAEEIAQEAYARIFERWDRVAAMEDSEGYLFRTAMNVFRNRYRRAALGVRRALSLVPQAVDDLAAVEDRDEVIRLLRPLAPRGRAAVVATSILDLSAEEAGRMLGMKPSTVRALASRARAHMREGAVEPR